MSNLKKYVLVKKYPGSPELGVLNTSSSNMTTLEEIVKYPENWEEFVEKDYEILSFIVIENFNNLQIGEIIFKKNTYRFSGKGNDGTKISSNSTTEEILDLKHWGIHSVKRLSDGEIFTIGDFVKSTIREFPITLIRLNKFGMLIDAEYEGSGMFNSRLADLEKIKVALFKTEDGVDIFEGDEYSNAYDDNYESPFWHFKTYSHRASKSVFDKLNNPGIYRFSTIEKAEEYILMNKKSLSINDVLEVWSALSGNSKQSLMRKSTLMSRIVEFVKLK